MYKKDIKATKFGLSVFTGKNYFLTEFAALSKNARDKMSEIFVNKTLFGRSNGKFPVATEHLKR